jgi:hypothetical protein
VIYFSGNEPSDFEIGLMGIDGLAYDEATTIQELVTYIVRLSPVKLSLCKP